MAQKIIRANCTTEWWLFISRPILYLLVVKIGPVTELIRVKV